MTTDADSSQDATAFDPTTLPLGVIEAPPDPRTLRLTDFLVPSELPSRPQSFSNAAAVSPWLMLGNDSKGDCVLVAITHFVMLSARLAGVSITPTDAEVIAQYLVLTGGQDSGLVIRSALSWFRKNPWLGARLSGFCSVDARDDEVNEIAISLFGAVGRGILLPKSAQSQTGPGPNSHWTAPASFIDPNTRPSSWGGHMTLDVGYTPDYLQTITWGFVQLVDPNFYPAYSMESYALVPTAKVPGFDYAKFYEALRAVSKGGVADVDADPVPIPVPVPPSPTPIPTPPVPVAPRSFHYDRFVRQDWLKYDDNGEEFTWVSSGRYN